MSVINAFCYEDSFLIVRLESQVKALRAAATLREKEIEELRAKLEAVPVAALQSINSFASEYAPEDGDWPTEDEFDQADRWLSTVTK